MAKSGMHCFVSGRVQGVFYRANTQRKAVELGLTGWVRNLDDGRVEAMLFGEAENMALMKDWLWQGPSAAKVVAVEMNEVPWQAFTGFVVK